MLTFRHFDNLTSRHFDILAFLHFDVLTLEGDLDSAAGLLGDILAGSPPQRLRDARFILLRQKFLELAHRGETGSKHCFPTFLS